ncbi:hypothetical protein LTR10_024040 [Elasticomyces elasticus]|uniref:C2H2-type domain-containing protein n=1 Tax=Exophiala sideris TaxID=1016849 RepID=A0ABR0IUZ5_9EURO|nr:hypothetical protein LTR10_024040 [Elasticomyces elasticus]KAK5021255.1 hypothetical protein LTS07_011170 [Exophiala sideris]KAK5030200.1 hypothetical protein LTR13_008218 [Exophiala sideris]KAK5049142.1 hypothetical protein LTR69_011169 [Exophiala sideris]KAK5176430.1 hypothetical protein LTR44_011052 [Eurotiomycetes sp. CCFEE 6388]
MAGSGHRTQVSSENDHLLQRIAYHKAEGRARSRRKPWSQTLVQREVDFWRYFCDRIRRDSIECLTACEPQTIKTYLEWRVQNFRVKKESTLKSYWKRVSCAYIDYAGHRMDNGTELDIRDWIPTYLTPTYQLETSEKDKYAMFVRDFYVIIHAHWVEDTRPLHGLVRLELSALYLLSAATATRPGALVESNSARGSNKALWMEHVEVLKIRHPTKSDAVVLAVKVNLVHIKDSGVRKKFIFYEEPTLAYCLVYQIVALAVAYDAFRRPFTSVSQLFGLTVPPGRDVLRLKFKPEILTKPLFRDVERTPSGSRIADGKALPYHKYRDHHVHLGRLSGFEHPVELYQLRRGSGRNINSVVTPEERNQVMGHHGNTYEQFYLPDLIERDFQSIYFGTAPQEELIQAVARMGLTRDKRAPIELTAEQKLEVRNDPQLVSLRARRDGRRERLIRRGYYPLSSAAGQPDYTKYQELNREINNMTTSLKTRRLREAIREFHDNVDGHEIDRQLDGLMQIDGSIRAGAEMELPERALVAQFITLSPDDCRTYEALGGRVGFVDAMVKLCLCQEGRRYRSAVDDDLDGPSGNGLIARTLEHRPLRGLEPRLQETGSSRASAIDAGGDKSHGLEVGQHVLRDPGGSAALTFHSPICLICIGEQGWSAKARLTRFSRRSTLKRHLRIHTTAGQFKSPFRCRVPGCRDVIRNMKHYMNHSAQVHSVFH